MPGISDHEKVYIESSLKPQKVKKPPRNVYQYNKANTEQITEQLKDIDLAKYIHQNNPNINQLWGYFRDKLHETMDKKIQTKLINNSKRKPTWLNREIKSLIRKRNKLFKKMKQTPSNKTTAHYKETKRRIRKATRNAYWQYVENIICYDENIQTAQKQKKFWNLIRYTKKDSSGVAHL